MQWRNHETLPNDDISVALVVLHWNESRARLRWRRLDGVFWLGKIALLDELWKPRVRIHRMGNFAGEKFALRDANEPRLLSFREFVNRARGYAIAGTKIIKRAYVTRTKIRRDIALSPKDTQG